MDKKRYCKSSSELKSIDELEKVDPKLVKLIREFDVNLENLIGKTRIFFPNPQGTEEEIRESILNELHDLPSIIANDYSLKIGDITYFKTKDVVKKAMEDCQIGEEEARSLFYALLNAEFIRDDLSGYCSLLDFINHRNMCWAKYFSDDSFYILIKPFTKKRMESVLKLFKKELSPLQYQMAKFDLLKSRNHHYKITEQESEIISMASENVRNYLLDDIGKIIGYSFQE